MSVEHGVQQLRPLPRQSRWHRLSGDPGQGHHQLIVGRQSQQMIQNDAAGRRCAHAATQRRDTTTRRSPAWPPRRPKVAENVDRQTAHSDRLEIFRVRWPSSQLARSGITVLECRRASISSRRASTSPGVNSEPHSTLTWRDWLPVYASRRRGGRPFTDHRWQGSGVTALQAAIENGEIDRNDPHRLKFGMQLTESLQYSNNVRARPGLRTGRWSASQSRRADSSRR